MDMKAAAVVLLVAGIALLGWTQVDTSRTLRDDVVVLDNIMSDAGVSTVLETGVTLRIRMETQQPIKLSVYRLPMDAPADEERDLFLRALVDSVFDGSIVLPNKALWDVSVANVLDTPNVVHFTVRVGDTAVKTVLLAGGLASSALGIAAAALYWPSRVAGAARDEPGMRV